MSSSRSYAASKRGPITSECLERPPRQLLHDVHEMFRQSEQTCIAGDLAHMRHLVKQAVAGATFEDGTNA